MTPRRILLVVPYKARDLEGHALLAYHLRTRYGHEVLFSNGYGIERKLLSLAPDALVLDHLAWDFKARQARLASGLGIKLVLLSTEGLFQDPEAAARRTGNLHGVAPLIDCFIAWGDYPRRAVLERNLMDESHIHVAGCPRFDLYCEPYSALGVSREELLHRLKVPNPAAALILWATNTPYAVRSSKKMRRRYVRRARYSSTEGQAIVTDQRTQLREHSALVLALARRHPGWNVVVKVHPAEWINPYVELAKQSPNIFLAYDAPIQDFVRHCDVLLQRNCTTATEAWILGKPVLSLEVGSYVSRARQEYLRGNDVVNSLDEADRTIQEYLTGKPVSPEQQAARASFIEDFYFTVDGRASERSANLIHQSISPPEHTDEAQQRLRAATDAAYARWQEAERQRPANRLKDFLGVRRDVSLRFWNRIVRRKVASNLGLFTPEVEITPAMVNELFLKYESLLALPNCPPS